MKLLIYTLIIVVVIAGVVSLGYYLHSRQNVSAPAATATTGILPSAGTQSQQTTAPAQTVGGQILALVSSEQAAAYFPAANSDNVVFVKPDGEVSEVSGDQESTLSTSTLGTLVNASFSFDGRKILATFGTQQNNFSEIFDIAGSAWQTLTSDVQNPAWSPNNYKIAYLAGASGGKSQLKILDLGKKNPAAQTLITFYQQGLVADWAYPDEIFLSERPSALSLNPLWSFEIKGQNLASLSAGEYGLKIKWDAQNNEGLDFIANRGGQNGGTNYLIDNTAQTIHKMNFLTLPDKCAFQTLAASSSAAAQTSLYCAIPRDVSKLNSAALPDAYYQKSLTTQDDFYQINLTSGQITSVFNSGNQALDATDLKIANQKIYFINRVDGKIYSINIQS